jgi:pimeloyl-ACP methyl ester carboxylesterase
VLAFDFRSHGESQRGPCAGGLNEDQDVVGAVDATFRRIAADAPGAEPQVGVVGFGLGAMAALVAVGREKGGTETIRVFSGDSEGGFGWVEIPPTKVKRLRFVVAIQPAALGVLLRGYLHQVFAPLSPILTPLVDRMCQRRGGYPLDSSLLLQFVRNVQIPVLYIQARRDPWGGRAEAQQFFDTTPGP